MIISGEKKEDGAYKKINISKYNLVDEGFALREEGEEREEGKKWKERPIWEGDIHHRISCLVLTGKAHSFIFYFNLNHSIIPNKSGLKSNEISSLPRLTGRLKSTQWRPARYTRQYLASWCASSTDYEAY